jgi:hypothetical protein
VTDRPKLPPNASQAALQVAFTLDALDRHAGGPEAPDAAWWRELSRLAGELEVRASAVADELEPETSPPSEEEIGDVRRILPYV